MAERPAIVERSGFGLATVMARRGIDRAAIGGALGFAIADGPVRSSGAALTLLGTGPGVWLALADDAPPDWAASLRSRLETLASLSDQSSAYVVHRIAGAGARTLLQRGAAIDFHPSSFAPGAVVATVIAHIGVVIWQVDERPAYDVAVARSFAGSFRHWLDAALGAF